MKYVSPYYTSRSLYYLFKRNIKPVVISTLKADGETSAPNKRRKNQPGRPKNKRMRYRSKFESAEDSTIACSLCTRRGHNKRRCPYKTEIEQQLAAAATSNLGDAERAAAIDPGYARNIM